MADQDQLPVTSGQDRGIEQSAKAQTKAVRAAAKAEAKAQAKAERKRAREERDCERAEKETKILKNLKLSVKTQARSATFACGGSVAFKTDAGPNTDFDTIEPIHLRFGENGKGFTLTLPLNETAPEELNDLLKTCQPASFGRGNEEVLDETYRKAGKLDRAAFATTFCPYEAGIIDVVSQLLVPQTKQDKHHCSIKAELYKLNVYSAPSGKFKAHVDTPRSEAQIGSLIVCLPIDHEGGQLFVRNADEELVFDWSASAKIGDGDEAVPSIEWAAFYSDCEHEVFEVTSGHRITLTYNLYVTRGLGHLAGTVSALDPTQLPLYEMLGGALEDPGFLRYGRVLAVWLNHSYAHTNKHLNFLPSSLKGADMSLYETARALGLQCLLGPVITADFSWEEMSNHHVASKFYGFNEGDNGSGNLDPEGGEGFGVELQEGKVTWINPTPKKAKRGAQTGQAADAEANSKQFKEAQMAYMTYGNEPGIDIWYSRAVMLIRIPPYRLRRSKHPTSFWADIRDDHDEEFEYASEDYEYEFVDYGYGEDEEDEDSVDDESDERMDEDEHD